MSLNLPVILASSFSLMAVLINGHPANRRKTIIKGPTGELGEGGKHSPTTGLRGVYGLQLAQLCRGFTSSQVLIASVDRRK